MNALKRAMVGVAAAAIAFPAAAQSVPGNESTQFVSALRKGDGDTALQLLSANPTLVDARDTSGNTPLITAIENRDEQWAGYLLKQRADPNLAQKNGDTPLIAASRMGMPTVAEWLIGLGAKIDDANRMGETPLIVAVQQRHVPIVRLLVRSGADPDIADSAAGYSARDYAKRDSRTPEMLRIINEKKPKP